MAEFLPQGPLGTTSADRSPLRRRPRAPGSFRRRARRYDAVVTDVRPPSAEGAAVQGRLSAWQEVLRTTNPPSGRPLDPVSRWLVLTRAAVLVNYAGRPVGSAGQNWLITGSDSRAGLTPAQEAQLATGHDVGLDHQIRRLQGLFEAPCLHMREIQLAQQQSTRRAVDSGAESQPTLCIFRSCAGRTRERRLPKQQLRSRSRGAAGASPSHP